MKVYQFIEWLYEDVWSDAKKLANLILKIGTILKITQKKFGASYANESKETER